MTMDKPRSKKANALHQNVITLSDGDTLVRIWTSQHHVIQHLRKDKRFTETADPSRCTTEEAEFTIPRTEWTPWGGAKHRRQLTDEQQIMEQAVADIREYWPFRRTARYREAACHSTGTPRWGYIRKLQQGCGVKTPATIAKENTTWLN